MIARHCPRYSAVISSKYIKIALNCRFGAFVINCSPCVLVDKTPIPRNSASTLKNTAKKPTWSCRQGCKLTGVYVKISEGARCMLLPKRPKLVSGCRSLCIITSHVTGDADLEYGGGWFWTIRQDREHPNSGEMVPDSNSRYIHALRCC